MSVNRTDKLILCPAAGVHTGITDIMYKIGDFIKNKFPEGFFKTYHYETKDGFMSHYAEIKQKQIKGIPMVYDKRQRPRLVILYDNRNSDTKDTGLGDVNPFTYPMVQGVHPDYNGYIKFFEDPNGLVLMTSDKRVKVDLQLVVETQSVYDQESVLNYLENALKMQYGDRLSGITARYILPSHMIKVLKNTLFHDNLNSAMSEPDGRRKEELLEKIQFAFDEYLKQYSGGGIEVRYKNGDRKKPYYIYNRTYRQIYFQVTGLPEKNDGDKKGEVYSKFSVTMNAFFEFYKPITYMLKSPEVVCGKIFGDIVRISRTSDKQLNTNPIGLVDCVKQSKTHVPTELSTNFKEGVIWKETDVTLMPEEDEIDLDEWMDKPEDRKYVDFMKKCEDRDFYDIFKVHVYEGDVPFPEENVKIVDRTKLKIYNASPNYLYTIYLVGNVEDMNNLAGLYVDK